MMWAEWATWSAVGGLHYQRDGHFDGQPPTRRLAQDGRQVAAVQ